ncbi:MAG: Uma2 family endonuclease [Caldilineaceae bacterium]
MATRIIEEPVRSADRQKNKPPTGLGNGALLPLENGDRLSRSEFERRYSAHPEIIKAELIEGVVYVASPVRVRRHGSPHSKITIWLGLYLEATPGLDIADNATLRLDLDNELQPDVAVWIDGGNAFVDDDDYLQGAPELLVEVAGSSAAIDLHQKLQVYRRSGVAEYLVLLTHEQEVRWYSFATGETVLIEPNAAGVLCSHIFPGLHLHPMRFWQGDLPGVLAVLRQGLTTPEHADFVARQRAHHPHPPQNDTSIA